mmetsp:Transcript_99124/g.285044  ORF Transcript_99124/g.285044 Transcript_99124/m.285044 type:complete len:224 (-) Transcript_99124:555-1226(-)
MLQGLPEWRVVQRVPRAERPGDHERVQEARAARRDGRRSRRQVEAGDEVAGVEGRACRAAAAQDCHELAWEGRHLRAPRDVQLHPRPPSRGLGAFEQHRTLVQSPLEAFAKDAPTEHDFGLGRHPDSADHEVLDLRVPRTHGLDEPCLRLRQPAVAVGNPVLQRLVHPSKSSVPGACPQCRVAQDFDLHGRRRAHALDGDAVVDGGLQGDLQLLPRGLRRGGL